MSDGMIKEFLVGLGFKVDEKSLKGFRDGVENATRAVQRLAVTVTAAATAMAAGVTVLASRLERIDFMSKRVHASASSLKALSHTAKNFGLDAQAALGSIENLSRGFRNNPGLEAYAQALGVKTREANGSLRDRVDIMTDLSKAISHMPDHLVDRYAGIFGVDPEVMRKAADPAFTEELKRRKEFLEQSGFNQASKDAHGFMVAVRELGWRFELFSMQVQGALIRKLGPALDRLMKWIEKHGPKMAAKLADVAERLLNAVILLAPYLGMLIDKFLELDEATGGWSTSLLAVLAVLKMLGGGAIIGGILRLAGALGGAAAAGGMGVLGKAGLAGAAAMLGLGVARALGVPDTDLAIGAEAIKNGDWWRASMYLPAADFLGAAWGKVVGGKSNEAIAGGLGDSAEPFNLANTPFGNAIAKAEGDYNLVNTGEKHGKKAKRVDLESMTLDEVMQAQARGDFAAAGRYQIMPGTLREAKAKLNLNGSDLFDRRMQNRIFQEDLAGLKRPALAKFLRGLVPITPETLYAAEKDASMEWAGWPDPATGKSFYRDGFNKAHIGLDQAQRALLDTRAMIMSGGGRAGMTQTNDINVNVYGATDPQGTARAVADHIVFQEENLARSMQGVTN